MRGTIIWGFMDGFGNYKQKFACIFQCIFYGRNDLKLLGPWPKNVKNYCCKGFSILLDQLFIRHIESSRILRTPDWSIFMGSLKHSTNQRKSIPYSLLLSPHCNPRTYQETYSGGLIQTFERVELFLLWLTWAADWPFHLLLLVPTLI